MNFEAWTETLPDEALRDLELREWHAEESDAYCELLEAHHYLGCPNARVRHLRQVVLYEGKAVALLSKDLRLPPVGRHIHSMMQTRTGADVLKAFSLLRQGLALATQAA